MFEIAKTATGYASTPTVLVNFDGTHGGYPYSGLIADAAGDLFGTTSGLTNGDGTVFEIVKTADGYASTPKILASFDGTNGANPLAGLFADAAGNLFGTTEHSGANNAGTVFEITGSGFVVAPIMLNAGQAANGLTTLSGTAEPRSTVSLFDRGNLIGGATVAADGTWSFQTNVAGAVVHQFTETSLDQNGSIVSPIRRHFSLHTSSQQTVGRRRGQRCADWRSKRYAYR